MRRKRIKPGQLVDARLTPQERDLIVERTFIDGEISQPPRRNASWVKPAQVEELPEALPGYGPAAVDIAGDLVLVEHLPDGRQEPGEFLRKPAGDRAPRPRT